MTALLVLEGVLTEGASPTIDLGQPMQMVTFQFALGGEEPAAHVEVAIEQSLDGTLWTQTDMLPVTGDCIWPRTIHPCRFLRLNVLSIVGGSEPTMTALVLPLN